MVSHGTVIKKEYDLPNGIFTRYEHSAVKCLESNFTYYRVQMLKIQVLSSLFRHLVTTVTNEDNRFTDFAITRSPGDRGTAQCSVGFGTGTWCF